MRKLIIGAVAVAAVALLGVPVAARAATPTNSGWMPVTNPAPPYLAGGTGTGSACSFQVDIAVVVNDELMDTISLPGGDSITQVVGKLVLSFKNDNTGKTLVEDVSGPSTTLNRPDGSGVETGTGRSWWAFGPMGRANTGEPGLIFTQGPIITTFAIENGEPTTQTFTLLAGTQQNACALLS